MDPMSIMMIMNGASGLLSMFGKAQQDKAEAEEAATQARAAISQGQQQKFYSKVVTDLQVKDYKKAAGKVMARQRVDYTASGVEADTGTPLMVAMESAREAEEELQRIRFQGVIDQKAYDDQIAGFREQLSTAKSASKKAWTNTLLTGIPQVAGSAIMDYGVRYAKQKASQAKTQPSKGDEVTLE
jgi:hypothetical protein